MNKTDVKHYASINPDGAVLLGNHTVCDGASFGRKIGVFTHIHDDHIGMFNKAMHNCSSVFMTKPTYDMLAALQMSYSHNMDPNLYFKGRHVYALDFNEPKRPGLEKQSSDLSYGDALTLYQTNHVLGSAQVLLKTDDGTRIVYSGDFAVGTKPVPCDILVLDPTHGDPTFNTMVERASLENRLVEFVDEAIRNNNGVVVHAHIGRLQETMHLLSKRLSKQVKFLSSQKNIRLAGVYKNYNMPSRDLVDVESVEADIIREREPPYVRFESGRRSTDEDLVKAVWKNEVMFSIGGSRLESGTVIKPDKDGNYKLEFMDHANFDYIINFIKESKPKWVLLDHTRGKQVEKLAKHLHDRDISVLYNCEDVDHQNV